MILNNLQGVVDPRILVGFETGDDAAVIQVRDDIAVVQTLDFFMPIVDDPKTFGMIAAANAISDVYAMGAHPVMALAILGFPTKKLSNEVAREIMIGGTEICRKVGIQIAGGHSIDDTEPKFGLSVTGIVHPDDIWKNSTAQEGDYLVLTKPLGIGAMGSANKKGLLSSSQYRDFVTTTTFVNEIPAKVARSIGINAATDVTGFGLLGHSLEMAMGSGLQIELWSQKLPVIEGARDLIQNGVRPGATGRTLRYVEGSTIYGDEVTELDKAVLADPQTSGGLLLAVSPNKVDDLCQRLLEEGALCGAVVGQFKTGIGVRVQ